MKKQIFSVLALVIGFVVSGRGKPPQIIDKMNFEAFPNLETVQVSLDFSRLVQTEIGGSYPISSSTQEYGSIFLEPSTATTPFRAGFRTLTSIVNDPEFNDHTRFEPVTKLPSGYPIPNLVNRALAQVKAAQPIHKKVDLYFYIDVLGGEWFGVAFMLPILDFDFIPANFTLFQNFFDSRASVSIFGTKKNNAGKTTSPPGFAFFANMTALMEDTRASGQDVAKGPPRQVYVNF